MRYLLPLSSLLLVVACGRSPTPAPAPPSVARVPAAASTASAPPAPPRDPCAAVAARNAAVVRESARELAAAVAEGRIPKEWTEGRPAMATPCFRTPRGGAWAVALEKIAHGGVVETSWQALHLDERGGEVGQPAEESFVDVCCSPTARAGGFRVADVDDDGEPEFLFEITSEGPEGGGGTEHRALTFRGGKIMPLVLPFEGPLGDVDGDGRLDLSLIHDTDDRMDCVGYSWEPLAAPSFFLRGLPGGVFSPTDPVAIQHARAVCQGSSPRIVEKNRGIVDEKRTARNALCARAGGRPAAEIAAEIARSCKAFEPRTDCDDVSKLRPDECRHRATVLSWVARLPAFVPPAPGP